MKFLSVLFALFSLALALNAEVLVIPSGQGGKLAISTGEVAIVTAYTTSAGGGLYTDIIFGGVTNTLPLGSAGGSTRPAAFAGPMDITFSASVAHLLSYKRMQSTAFKSAIVSYGLTNRITIPAGKTLRCFSANPIPGNLTFTLTQGTNNFSGSGGILYPGAEFTGPVEITLTDLNPPANEASVLSYYFTEDFLVTPNFGFLQGPTGAFEITVEKTVDLTNWYPVSVQNTSDDQKAFYRLRLAR